MNDLKQIHALVPTFKLFQQLGKPISKAVWNLVRFHKHDLTPGGHGYARDVIDTLFSSIMGHAVKLAHKATNRMDVMDLSILLIQAAEFLKDFIVLMHKTDAATFEPELPDMLAHLKKVWPHFLSAQNIVDDTLKELTETAAVAILMGKRLNASNVLACQETLQFIHARKISLHNFLTRMM